MKILITGCAGFIGYHLTNALCKNNKYQVFGIDNLSKYYDIGLKKDRLKILKKNTLFKFFNIDIKSEKKIDIFFKKHKFNIVVHLAAQAGVRYSIYNPKTYIKNNINGFFNILNSSMKISVKHFMFASTSSVYGDSHSFPTKELSSTDKPLSIYAATKKSNEVIAYSYSNIYKIPITGLRFFTVYGPFGRPDMFLFKYVNAIFKNKIISLFNNGNHVRDFTHVDDVVASIVRLVNKPPKNNIPFEIYNIGSDNPFKLKTFISFIDKRLLKKPKIINIEMQKGDVYKTHADIKKLKDKIIFKPKQSLNKGIKNFIDWYTTYYK